MKITKEQAKFLVEVYAPIRKGTIGAKTINTHIDAINIILGQNRGVPSCGCEYKTMAMISNSAYEQFEAEILKVYNSKPRKRRTKKDV